MALSQIGLEENNKVYTNMETCPHLRELQNSTEEQQV